MERNVKDMREPLDAWRYFSRRAHALMNIAAALKRGKRCDRADWLVLDPIESRIGYCRAELAGYPSELHILASRGLTAFADHPTEIQYAVLSAELTTWLILGRVGFALAVGPDRSQLEIYYAAGLFGALALQMALTLSRTKSLYTCSGCGVPYVRVQKSPKPGQANFCEACGRKEAVRQANQRRKQKMAEARRLHSEGVAAGAIAKRLSTKPATVRGWVKKARS
jgi:predicted RNA-binding Zn-ribbon protein involved in translation (DUF1610 family)